METRANYVLIGAFTLAGVLGLLGFFVWIARLQVDRQYDYYDVLFDNVAGLSRAASVLYNGLAVGQVLSLDIDEVDPTKVKVRIEVKARTPITDDTQAQLRAQGVTGVSYVALTPGRPDAPLLLDGSGTVPRILAQRSIVEALTEDVPEIVSEAITVLKNLQTFIGPENQGYVSGILANLDQASGQLQTALADFSKISGTIEAAAGQVGDFTGRLDDIGTSVKTTLATADQTLKSADGAFAAAEATLTTADEAIQSAGRTFDGAEAVIRDQVPDIAADLSAAVAALRTAITDVGNDAGTVLGQFGSAAGLASDRLTELETTLAALDSTLAEASKTMVAVESASTSFETLIDGEGVALVADARKALADAQTSITAIDKVVTEDVPVIVADVRAGVATANQVIQQASGELKPLTDSAQSTLSAATQTFRDASGTLARLDTAMDTAERTLTAAEATFTGANRVIDEEVAPTAADIRAAAERLGTAVTKASADLPAITSELRTTLARATEVVARLDGVVAASGPSVEEFATGGLPQFVHFAQEARALIASLERIAARLERDPARFLLGGRAPDYRR